MVEEIEGFSCELEPELIYLYFETDEKKISIPLKIAKKIPFINAAINLDDTILNNINNPIIVKKNFFHSSKGIETIIDYVSFYLDKEEPTTERIPILNCFYLEDVISEEEVEIFEKHNKPDGEDEFGKLFMENIIHAMALAYYFHLDELSHKLSKCCAFIIRQHPEYYKLDELNKRLKDKCPSDDENDD